jgi:hypothetical protein
MRASLACAALLSSIAAVGSLGACSAPAEEPAGGATALSAATGPSRQLIPWVSRATLESQVDAFRARNGASWIAVDDNFARRALPIVTHVKRADPEGPAAPLPADAEAQAVRFARANADLLGFTAAEGATFQVFPNFGAVHPNVTLRIDRAPQAGFEKLAYRVPLILFVVTFGGDGAIRELSRLAPLTLPELSIDPQPSLPASDALFHRALLGRALSVVDDPIRTFHPPPPGPPRSEGTITEHDLMDVEVTLSVTEEDAGLSVSLAYDFSVERADCPMAPAAYWHYLVDTETGAVLDGNDLAHCVWEW